MSEQLKSQHYSIVSPPHNQCWNKKSRNWGVQIVTLQIKINKCSILRVRVRRIEIFIGFSMSKNNKEHSTWELSCLELSSCVRKFHETKKLFLEIHEKFKCVLKKHDKIASNVAGREFQPCPRRQSINSPFKAFACSAEIFLWMNSLANHFLAHGVKENYSPVRKLINLKIAVWF